MDLRFHCSEESNFRTEREFVRAFSYKDYYIEPHNHDFYEMNIVLGGNGIHLIEDASFKVSTGDVFVIPPLTVHAYVDTEELEVYHVLLKKDFIRDNKEESSLAEGFLQLTEIEPYLRQSFTEAMFLHLSPAELEEVKKETSLLEDGGEFDKAGSEPLKRHTAWRLLYYLSHLLSEQNKRELAPKENKYKKQILDTLEYIHLHFSEKITVEDLARRVYMSRSTFLRCFSAVCGKSPTDYVKDYRIRIAKELLTTGRSKTEIAHEVGFYDLSHMEKSIKNG